MPEGGKLCACGCGEKVNATWVNGVHAMRGKRLAADERLGALEPMRGQCLFCQTEWSSQAHVVMKEQRDHRDQCAWNPANQNECQRVGCSETAIIGRKYCSKRCSERAAQQRYRARQDARAA